MISWSGQIEAAQKITKDLEGHVERVTIIHSEPGLPIERRGTEISLEVVDNEWFFGKKFQRAIELANAGQVLVIQADARFEDWPGLVDKFRSASAAYPLGVWAPNVDHTSWITSKVSVRELNGKGLVQVSQTDAVVLGLSYEIIAELKKLDFSENNLGWGIEWAAIALSMTMGRLVLRDTSLTVRHPRGSGYQQHEAHRQQEIFLSQLDPAELAVLTLLRRSHMLSRAAVRRAVSVSNRWARLSSLVAGLIPKPIRSFLSGTIERVRGTSR